MKRKNKKMYLTARNYTALGAYLKRARVEANLTQREVSEVLGYSSGQIVSNFESGIMAPPLDKLRSLIKIYDIPEHDILELLLEAERGIILRALTVRKIKKNG